MEDKKTFLKIGSRVIIEISGKKYAGVISACDRGNTINVKIAKPDMNLIHILSGALCTVQASGGKTHIYTFKTTIHKRKIPLIILKYPERIEIFSRDELKSVPTSIWCSVLIEKHREQQDYDNFNHKLKEVDDGTVVKLNILGCRLMTHYRTNIDKIIWLSLLYNDDNDAALICKGIVKSMESAPYDATYYDIEFEDMNENNRKKLENIIDKPTA